MAAQPVVGDEPVDEATSFDVERQMLDVFDPSRALFLQVATKKPVGPQLGPTGSVVEASPAEAIVGEIDAV